MTARPPRGAATWAAAAGFAALFWATAASNGPHQGFDRLRNLDARSNVLPNWRFFAPNPAVHDTHVLYRVRHHDGRVGAWDVALEPSPRVWWNMVVHPGRRNEKAIFDVVESIITAIAAAPLEVVERRTPFKLLHAFVARRVRGEAGDGPLPDGLQIAIVRHTGYDDAGDTEYLMVSRLLPVSSPAHGHHWPTRSVKPTGPGPSSWQIMTTSRSSWETSCPPTVPSPARVSTGIFSTPTCANWS